MIDSNVKRPWWFPERVGPELVARLRLDYPNETSGLSDECVLDYFDYTGKYAILWDNIGDSKGQFERLADAFFELLAACEDALNTSNRDEQHIFDNGRLRGVLRAAIANATGKEFTN